MADQCPEVEGNHRTAAGSGDAVEFVGVLWLPNGPGLLEYLLLCRDLVAEPLLVVNCGMSHREVVPLSGLDVWMQDALDAVEFANGPVTSRWGAVPRCARSSGAVRVEVSPDRQREWRAGLRRAVCPVLRRPQVTVSGPHVGCLRLGWLAHLTTGGDQRRAFLQQPAVFSGERAPL